MVTFIMLCVDILCNIHVCMYIHIYVCVSICVIHTSIHIILDYITHVYIYLYNAHTYILKGYYIVD